MGGEDFQNLLYGSETMHMTSEGLREMSEGHFPDMCAEKFSQTQCSRTPIGISIFE